MRCKIIMAILMLIKLSSKYKKLSLLYRGLQIEMGNQAKKLNITFLPFGIEFHGRKVGKAKDE